MNTKLIMTASALLLGSAGIVLIFMPEEILHYLNIEAMKSLQLLVQTLGALYFSCAMINWMTRTSLIGGIYNRPIAVANLTHFSIAGLALIKWVISDLSLSYVIWIIAGAYSIFVVSFGAILFRHPLTEKKPE